VKGWKDSDVIHPDDLQHTIDALMKAHETARRSTLRAAIVALMDLPLVQRSSACPCAILKEKSFAGFHLLIDIDGRKRAEASARCEKRPPGNGGLEFAHSPDVSHCFVQIC